MEGKGIFYHKNGDRYEGEFKYWLRDGNGILYYKNGDRIMGDYANDKPIGIHVKLEKTGNVKVTKY